MPRGEHFKKENPRINQVSFKVNDTELKALQDLAKKEGIAVATWLRNQINIDRTAVTATVAVKEDVENIEPVKIPSTTEATTIQEEERVELKVEPKVEAKKPKIEKIAVEKPKAKTPPANEQMSLF